MIGKPPPRPPGPSRKLDLVELRIANLRRELEAETEPRTRQRSSTKSVRSTNTSSNEFRMRFEHYGASARRRARLPACADRPAAHRGTRQERARPGGASIRARSHRNEPRRQRRGAPGLGASLRGLGVASSRGDRAIPRAGRSCAHPRMARRSARRRERPAPCVAYPGRACRGRQPASRPVDRRGIGRHRRRRPRRGDRRARTRLRIRRARLAGTVVATPNGQRARALGGVRSRDGVDGTPTRSGQVTRLPTP